MEEEEEEKKEEEASNADEDEDEMDKEMEDEQMDGDDDQEAALTTRSLFDEDEEEESSKSQHQKRMERLKAQIEQFEQENIEDKHWTLRGEINAKGRPLNSLLEEDLEFDQSVKVCDTRVLFAVEKEQNV